MLYQRKGFAFALPVFSLLFSIISFTTLFSKNSGFSPDPRPLIEVLAELQIRYDVNFLYERKNLEGKVTHIKTDDFQSLEKILDKILPPLSLRYEKVNTSTYAILVKEKNTLLVPEEKAISYRLIKGRVTTQSGESIPGVIVQASDKKTGTVTDTAGSYSIRIPEPENELIFSCLGYKTMRAAFNGQAAVNVSLDFLSGELQEIVIVGYGGQEKRDVTGAVSTIRLRNITHISASGFEGIVQGRATGVQVVNSTGSPGAEVMVRVRGNASLFAENRPLYVIDGVPAIGGTFSGFYLDRSLSYSGGQHLNILADLNPYDIESIDVLKDASSSAIYGSRGTNGVVFITTRHPPLLKTGGTKLSVNYASYYGRQNVIRQYDLLDAFQYAAYAKEAIKNSGTSDTVSTSQINNTNWQEEIFRTAGVSDHHFSLSAQSEKTGIYVSGGSFNQEGIIIGSRYRRNNVKFNFTHEASEKIKIGLNTTLSGSKNKRIPEGINPIGILATALQRNPNLPVRQANGNFTDDPAGIENPVRTAEDLRQEVSGRRFMGNVYGEYFFSENLRLRSSMAADYAALSEDIFSPTTLQVTRNANSSFGSFTEELFSIHEHTLRYDNGAGRKNHFSALLGFSEEKVRFKSLTVSNRNGNNNSTPNVGNGTQPFNVNVPLVSWKITSFLGRINYSHRDKYLLTANMRSDGTSRFGNKKTFAFFPSLALGWRISEESFLKEVRRIDETKLRLSYGKTGNQEGIGTYNEKGMLIPVSGLLPDPALYAALPDASLEWESTEQFNAGLDLSFFKSRLMLVTDVYLKRSDDLLMSVFLPLDSGKFQEVVRNIGGMTNTGAEFYVQSKTLVSAFQWTTEFNISFSKSRITKMLQRNDPLNPNSSDFSEYIDAFGISGVSSLYSVGTPFGAFYGYVYEGVNTQTGAALYKDLNSDGKIDKNDRTVIGSPLPKHTGGLNNIFSFKNISLEVFFQWSYGNQIYNMSRAILDYSGNAHRSNATTDLLGRWQKPGDVTDVPKPLIGNQATSLALPSSRWVEDGSYLRMKNITLSYEFPEKIISKVRMKRLKVYLSAANWLTFTKYSGLDPESQNHSNKNSTLGIDLMTYPTAKSVVGGMSLGL